MDENTLNAQLIPHVFLPLKLPGKASDNLIAEENHLLSLFRNAIRDYQNIFPQVKETCSVFETWVEVQVNSCEIRDTIRTLQPGQLFALYARAQNCGLLISIPTHCPNDIIWSTFPASHKNVVVTGSPGDLEVSYPATSIKVKRPDVLNSSAFAGQLEVLMTSEFQEAKPFSRKAKHDVEEIRDTNTTVFISGWLPALLVTQDSTQSFGDIPRITKKIRDSVVYENALLPFRRSGMWTTAKVVLNISLVRDLGNALGLLMYKVVMLRIMLKFLQSPVFPAHESNGIEMLKKVGRRIRKLEKFEKQIRVKEPKFEQLNEVYNSLVDDATKIITSARKMIDQHWRTIIDAKKKDSMVALKGDPFNMTQSLIGNGLLDYLTSSSNVKPPKFKVCVPHVPPRHRISLREKYMHSILQSASSTICTYTTITLFDFERNVRQNWSEVITSADYEYVWKNFHEYLSSAMHYYRNDPVGMSRAIITALKMIQVWDQCVCRQYPLMSAHKIGIETGFVKMLLVVTKDERKIVDSLETYFLSRELAPSPCLLEETPSHDSFSVSFAAHSSVVRSLREVILEEGRQRIEAKIKEVEAARAYCESLRNRISQMSHTYDEKGRRKIHSTDCALCSLTTKEEDYTVTVYEKPLPEELYKQRAVVFELIIPSEIACLRDLLYTFFEKIATSVGNGYTRMIGHWSKDYQLSPHTLRNKQWKINLGSTAKHFVDSHYSKLHPSRSTDDFIVNNGYNTHYPQILRLQLYSNSSFHHVKDWCTLEVEPGSQYAKMQWAINGNSQTPNEVLARQSECHMNMSTSEFVEFGSVRCYYTQQIRSLIKATVLGTLSFKNESVFNLICQSLWECSPRIKNGAREANEDFLDSIFLQECLSIMENLLAKHKDNWQDHYIILAVIVFAITCAEKSEDLSILNTAGTLVLRCRDLTETWSVDIQSIISKMTNADAKQKDKLNVKLLEVNICRAFTFGAHKKLGSRTIATSVHVKNWLQAIVIVFDHLEFIRKNPCNQIFMLVRRVIELGVDVEECIIRSFGFRQSMNMFLRFHYGGADDLNFNNETIWTRYQGAEQVYFVEVKKKHVDETVTLQLDIVTGDFLVNGCKVSRLPEAMANHADFRRVFPIMSFEVQPLGPNEAVTKHAYEGSYYSFVLNEGTLIIEEIITGTSSRRTLVPSKYLPGNFPHKFEHEYSHWWNKETKTVEFFARSLREPLKIMGKECELLLDVRNGRKLQHLETKRSLADIRCPTYQLITKVLNRLEQTSHIHVWEINGQYSIELPRMRLSFVVTALGVNRGLTITSQEYEGMKIAENQQLETLVGLQQSLLLSNDVEKMLLVPHGSIQLNGQHHTSISTDVLSEPPYFRYDVDERLGQLKAGETQTGWFYLAYLHAVTSNCIPDPFTGVTGTERAFQLLNSGVCFPSQPFSPATDRIIHMLRNLAPTRAYYPKHMQVMETVVWPASVSPLAAHDNFVDVTNNIVNTNNRLDFLFDGAGATVLDFKDENIELRRKAAWRRSLISNGIDKPLSSPFLLHKPLPQEFTCGTAGIHHTVQVAHLCHAFPAELPNSKVFALLTELLLRNVSLLPGFDKKDVCSTTVRDWMSVEFTNSWLGIYEAARTVKRLGQTYEWIMFLSLLAFRQDDRVSVNQLAILITIATHYERFTSINPPKYEKYSYTSEQEYDESQIVNVLSSCVTTSFRDYAESNYYKRKEKEKFSEFKKRMKPLYQSECHADLVALEKAIKSYWPCEMIHSFISNRPSTQYYDWLKALDGINCLFTRWFRNRALHSFLEEVSATVQNICAIHVADTNTSDLVSAMLRIEDSSFENVAEKLTSRYPLRVRLDDFVSNIFTAEALDYFERVFCGQSSSEKLLENFPLKESNESQIFNEFIKDLGNSWNQWQMQKDFVETELKPLPDNPTVLWQLIYDSIKSNSEIYFLCDWFPRITPTTLLPLICKTFENGTPMSNLRKLVGGYAVFITREQQQCRIQRYRRQGNDLNLLEMKKEASNIGHTNWSPEKHPEWLLLEIENDFLIRPLQIKVAEQMQSPDGGRNSLMQMNMGEGKTAVIIPLLALSLADGRRLCRITVLRSLYQINLKSLTIKIGGLLLNRRLYTMPCRRDYAIDSANVGKMMTAYQECLDTRGVLLTLAEHRLSFELKKHEKALSGKDSDETAISGVLNWLQANARDVLDESDEILQVKYQLLYTLGEPLTINGGSLRWTIAQKILRLVPDQMKVLLKSEQIKFQLELKEATSGSEFPHCRILSGNIYEALCTGLCQDVITIGLIPEPLPAIKNIVLKFLTQEILNENEMQGIYESSCFSLPTHKDTLLTLRGLLACGVLRSCLSKRWRVNYGVNPTGHRRMAVPFRAKDIAAERAEFGHPDVAIVLTLLSYYYSGLSNDQLEDAFTRLFKLNFAEQEYQSWIALLPPTTPGLTSIKKLSGINLRDYRQKYNVVFPAMRRNMATIDFWLGQAVFPIESKQFGSKVGCSAWDLCRDNTIHPTTGFSGTNDTKLLLPRTIQQRDLPELLGTNGKVLENLLRPENNHYEGLQPHISAKQIIEKLVRGNIKVLLDVGAIMLELTNEKVADEWMAQCRDIEAVVFFGDKDHLLVKTSQASRPIEFETSPFRNKLDCCGIYLDEIHTRGTDLKIPLGTTAVVTLGKGVRKDTLAQGCMRMRKLGQGHTIRFWGSSEVHPQIVQFVDRSSQDKTPGSYAVLKWAIQNSVHFMEEGFIHWAGSGTYELQKRAAEKICDVNESNLLAKLCSQNEVLELMSMYGLEKDLLTYPCLAENMIGKTIEHLRSNLIASNHCVRGEEIRRDSKYMLQHLEQYAGQLHRTSNILDEEQERELEHELEEETQIEPTPPATAEKHVFNEDLRTFIRTGFWNKRRELALCSPHLHTLQNVFINSELRSYCETATSWGRGSGFIVLATQDFERTVVQTFERKSNDFLRPVVWIYNTVIEGKNRAILMSPYEVNECWRDFKAGKGTLHMYGPRLFRDQETLHESGPLMIPSRRGTHSVFSDVMAASLDILGGSFYFKNEAGERHYCCVAGISPKPRPAEEENLFLNGAIVNGFVDPIQRNVLPMFSGVSAFEEHPERLIRGIIEARHGVFSDRSHVGNVIVYGKKNFTG